MTGPPRGTIAISSAVRRSKRGPWSFGRELEHNAAAVAETSILQATTTRCAVDVTIRVPQQNSLGTVTSRSSGEPVENGLLARLVEF